MAVLAEAKGTYRKGGDGADRSNDRKVPLSAEDAWIDAVDIEAFKRDVRELGEELKKGQGEEDNAHLRKMIWCSNFCSFVGFFSSGVVPYYALFPAVMLSLGITTRWTMIAHHVCHGGYDNCDKSGRFNRFKFAVKSLWRRVNDWFDWMLPEAWNVEHNMLHHYHLGEQSDPDLVERNLEWLRMTKMPLILKYAIVGFFMITWKWSYYASNTFKELRVKEMRKSNPKELQKALDAAASRGGFDLSQPLLALDFFTKPLPQWLRMSDFLLRGVGPYFFYRFIIFPAPWIALGYLIDAADPFSFFKCSVLTCVLADMFANVHSFIIVVTNHAGDDLYKFGTKCKAGSATFYLRQVVSSANFAAGTDCIDFFHGWLNYQIEHHLL